MAVQIARIRVYLFGSGTDPASGTTGTGNTWTIDTGAASEPSDYRGWERFPLEYMLSEVLERRSMRGEYPYDSPGQEALELGMIIAGILVVPIIFVTVYWFRLTSMVEMVAVVLANMVVVFGVVPVVMARWLGRPLESLMSGETGDPWEDRV